MIEMHLPDIQVQDLGDKLTESLDKQGFHRVSLEDIGDVDRDYLCRRDRREIPCCVNLTPGQGWRSAADYLLYDNPEGTLAYIRHDPNLPRISGSLPVNVHFRTAAPSGFSAQQYYSLSAPQRNFRLLKEYLNSICNASIAFIADLDVSSVSTRIAEQLYVLERGTLPVRLFHSVYLSRKCEKQGIHSDKWRAVEELSIAVGALIVAAHLFSRKQIAYYKAAEEIDEIFSKTALVG